MPIMKILFTCSGMGARMKSSVAMLTDVRSSRPEVFCKKGVLKFCKIHRKTPVPASFWMKLQAEACNFIKKRDSGTVVFL